MRKLLRYAASAAGVIALGLLGAELASFLLLQGFSRWPTREQIQASLEPPGGVPDGEVAVADPDLPMLRDFVLHPYVGFVRNYERSVHDLNRKLIELPVNQLGFVGDPPPTTPSEQRFVVGVTGGSVAAELFLLTRHELARELARAPALQGREVQIVSFALAGMKQPQQLMALSYLLALGHHLDAVVNLDGFNEVALPLGENLPVGVSPAYPRNWRGYAARALDGEALWYAGQLEVSRREREAERRTFSRAPLRHSSLALLLWHQRLRAREGRMARFESGLRRQLSEEAGLDAQTRGPTYPGDPANRDQVVARSVGYWKRSSLQMAQLCQGQGIAYWHVLQPNLFFADTKPLSPWEASVVASAESSRFGPGAVRGFPRLLAAGAELRRQGVRFVDLSGLFADVPEQVYKDDCCHYHDWGYQRLARALARELAATVGAP